MKEKLACENKLLQIMFSKVFRGTGELNQVEGLFGVCVCGYSVNLSYKNVFETCLRRYILCSK